MPTSPNGHSPIVAPAPSLTLADADTAHRIRTTESALAAAIAMIEELAEQFAMFRKATQDRLMNLDGRLGEAERLGERVRNAIDTAGKVDPSKVVSPAQLANATREIRTALEDAMAGHRADLDAAHTALRAELEATKAAADPIAAFRRNLAK